MGAEVPLIGKPCKTGGEGGDHGARGSSKWSADSERTRVDDGIDTFVFQDGLAVRSTLQ